MTDNDKIDKIRKEYAAAMAGYQAAVDALVQFDRDLFDGEMIDFGIIVQEGQEFKSQEEAAYKRMSRARETYGQTPH